MRLIDADALIQHTYSAVIDGVETDIIDTSNVDNAPTIIWCSENSDGLPLMDLRPRGKCKSCRHRDPEDKKCDCGGMERQGCIFPVSDDYYCKYYDKGD